MNIKALSLGIVIVSSVMYQSVKAVPVLDQIQTFIAGDAGLSKARNVTLFAIAAYAFGETAYRRFNKWRHSTDPKKVDFNGFIKTLALSTMQDIGVVTQDMLQEVLEEVVKQIKLYIDEHATITPEAVQAVVDDVVQKKMDSFKPMTEEMVRSISEDVAKKMINPA